MRKLSIVALLLAFLVACETEKLAPQKTEISSPESEEEWADDWTNAWIAQSADAAGGRVSFPRTEFEDKTGKIKVRLFHKAFPADHTNSQSVQVSDRYVLIGGAAWVSEAGSSKSQGAFITESRPGSSEIVKGPARLRGYADTWFASSQDHLNKDRHTLHIVAIGLRLDGVAPEDLREYVRVYESYTGCANSRPSAVASVPSCYTLLGGGARVNGERPSNFLMNSFPMENSWYVGATDHGDDSPRSITAYAIGIQNNIPGFGYLETFVKSVTSENTRGGIDNAQLSAGGRWLISCPGASSNYGEGQGRMLMGIEIDPTDQQSRAITKDYINTNVGETTAYSILIRKGTEGK